MVQEAQAQEEKKISGVLGGVATVLNAGGHLMVKTYDLTAGLVGATAGVAGKVASTVTSASPNEYAANVFGKVKCLLSGGIGRLFGSNEKQELRNKVAEYDAKIKKLYYEIGKEGSTADKLESEKVTTLIGNVREYEQEIKRLQARIAEMSDMEALRKEEAKKENIKPVRKKAGISGISEEQAAAAVKAALEKALKEGDFDSDSQKAIFKKIANDLLDGEMEVRILAAVELGKMGLKAPVEVLLEAVKFDNVYLTAEIINSLTNIGDARALSLCKEMAKSPNHRTRISSLRGLYKMGSDEEIAPYMLEALNDEHPEVRKTAATFMGWKDIPDSVPGLIQTLQDKDESVRKAAVAALANIKDTSAVLPLMRALADESLDIRQKALEALKGITGEEISFDVELKGRELADAVNSLKDWWQSSRVGRIDELIPTVADSRGSSRAYAAPAPVSSAAAEAAATEKYSVETAPEETVEEAETTVPTEGAYAEADAGLAPEDLRRKLKSELIALCKARGLECDEANTKAELINLLTSAGN